MIRPGPFTGSTVSVAHLERLRQFALSLLPQPSADIAPERGPAGTVFHIRRLPGLAQARFFVGGVHKPMASWTGTSTNFLKVPFDGTTPSYIAEATFNAALTSGMPNDAEYYDLRATYGDQHVPRAG